jgi:hypothetical protein
MLPYAIVPTVRYTGDSISVSFEFHVPWRTNTIRRGKHHHSPRMHLQWLTPALNITSLPLSRLTSSYPMYHFIISSSNRNTLHVVVGLLPHHKSTLDVGVPSLDVGVQSTCRLLPLSSHKRLPSIVIILSPAEILVRNLHACLMVQITAYPRW